MDQIHNDEVTKNPEKLDDTEVCNNSKSTPLHWSHLISARSCFFDSIFHSFSQFSQKSLRIKKWFIYHMKDLKSEHLIL